MIRVLIAAALLIAALPAAADDSGKKARVEEFFRLARMEDTFKQATAQAMTYAKSGVIQQLTAGKATPEDQKAIDEFRNKVEKVVENAMGWDKIRPLYIQLYADTYTEEELDGIVSFYKSPAGQAMVSKNFVLMKQASEIAQQRMATAIPELQNLIAEFAQRQKK